MRIFIAGCARSGTTLMIKLMSSFSDTYALTSCEKPFIFFDSIETDASNIVLKRDFDSHKMLKHLPQDIDLIYMIRHPFDVLTSFHPDFPNRKYYVSETRWRAEYSALRSLQEAQPDRKIIFIDYEDLVSDPDSVQQALANRFGLKFDKTFSEYVDHISTNSIEKYKTRPELERYIFWLPREFRSEIKEYCDDFGYDLPQSYVGPPSPLGDKFRRLIARQMARNWRHKLSPFGIL